MDAKVNYFIEKEYKYLAENIKLSDFKKIMEKIKNKEVFIKAIQASSWDVYYVKENSPEEFQRFRNDGKTPELTKKVKIKNTNNWERVESDLPLDPHRISEEIVAFHLSLDSYKENFRIFKTCEIYKFDLVNYVWYSVYDENMDEIGRFVELEINKNKVTDTVSDIILLKKHEENLLELGITSQNRTRLSLFERYRK